MYLRKVAYQLGVRVKSLLPRFHKSHLRNLALSLVKIPIFSKLGSLHKRTRLKSGVGREQPYRTPDQHSCADEQHQASSVALASKRRPA